MRLVAPALVLAAIVPAATFGSTVTIDHTTPGAVWDGILEGFPGLPGRIGGNPLSVVRRGDSLELRSVMEFPLAPLAGVAPDDVVSATLTFNIDDVLSTLGPGTELSGRAARTILVHFYTGDGQAQTSDFGRTGEPATTVDTGPGTITDATLQQTGALFFEVDAGPRLRQALAVGTAFLGVLWRTNDSPTGTSIDDGRGGSSSGEPTNTVPGSRMPFLTVEIADQPPPNCGDGVLDAGEQCDDGNTRDGDCCDRLCALEPAGSACDTGDACTAGDACDGAGVCAAGGRRSCDDANPCTDDACDPAVGCLHTPANEGAACDDGNACTTGETCSAGRCLGTDADGDCDDGNPCTAGDTCSGGVCGGMPADGAACDDGDPCSENDVCGGGVCAGSPVCGNGSIDPACGEECDDGNLRAADGCSPACRHDTLLGGSGPRECLVRVAFASPVREADGSIAAVQECIDGDPACDADPDQGSCGFTLASCFGVPDPRIPGCGSAATVKGSSMRVQGRGTTRSDRSRLTAALRATALPGCTEAVTVRVPVRRRGRSLRAGKAVLVVVARAPGLGRDRDTVRLVCRPAS